MAHRPQRLEHVGIEQRIDPFEHGIPPERAFSM
jgi:hypothetical protein